MNNITITGYLGRDVEERETASGSKMATTSIADTQKIKGEDRTTWYNVIAFGNAADVLLRFFHKGSFAVLAGEIQGINSYTARGGEERASIDVLVTRVGFGPRTADSGMAPGLSSGSGSSEDEIPF